MFPAEVGELCEELLEPMGEMVWSAALLREQHPIHGTDAMVVCGAVSRLLFERLPDDRPRGH